MVSIDYRPTTGLLYGVGSDRRLYRINADTGQTQRVNDTPWAVPVNNYRIDFHPVRDELRVVGAGGRTNFRVHPDTGQIIDANPSTPALDLDRPLAFVNNPNRNPNLSDIAYHPDATSAFEYRLFGLHNQEALVRHTSFNAAAGDESVLDEVGGFDENPTVSPSFDIGPSGQAFAAMTLASNNNDHWLYRINLSTGRATPVGVIGNGNTRLNDLTVVPPSNQLRFSKATYHIGENGGRATITVTLVNPTGGAVAVYYTTSNSTATAGADYTGVNGRLSFPPNDLGPKSFSVPIHQDWLAEGDETINLRLSILTSGTVLGSPSTAVLTIVDDDKVSTLGVYNPTTSTFSLRNSNTPGVPDIGVFPFGAPGWRPLAGDWDGNGTDTVGAFDPATSTFHLRNSNTAGAADVSPFVFGSAGWLPVVGDWDGNGTDTVGAYDPATNTFYLRNSNTPGVADVGPFVFGSAGWLPVVGDWDGNGTDTVGAFDPATYTFHLRNSNTPGAADVGPFVFGSAGWLPLAGDWDGNRTSTIGGYDPATSTFHLRNSNTAGVADAGMIVFGLPGSLPVSGDWNGPAIPPGAMVPTDPGSSDVPAAEVRASSAAADGTLVRALVEVESASRRGRLWARETDAAFSLAFDAWPFRE
jgi:hypothetical protein